MQHQVYGRTFQKLRQAAGRLGTLSQKIIFILFSANAYSHRRNKNRAIVRTNKSKCTRMNHTKSAMMKAMHAHCKKKVLINK